MGSVDLAAVADWVARSCIAQGVPVFVSDPGVLSRVRGVIAAGDAGARPPVGGRAGAPAATAPTPG